MGSQWEIDDNELTPRDKSVIEWMNREIGCTRMGYDVTNELTVKRGQGWVTLGELGIFPQCWVARDHHSVGSAISCHWRTCVSLAVRCLCELCLHRVGASSDMVIVVIILMRDKTYYSGCACKVDLCMWQGDLEVPASRLAFDFLGEGCNGRNAATKNG